MKIFHFFLVLYVLLFSAACSGQEKNLLSQNASPLPYGQLSKIPKPQGANQEATINSALQDKAGNLWFGANGEGVYRYDGKSFQHFAEKEGLSDAIVYALQEDSAGNIWIGTKDGLFRYNGSSIEKITIEIPFSTNVLRRHPAAGYPPTLNGVWSMMLDKRGVMWFGTDAGVYCYDGKRFTDFLDSDNLINRENLHLKVIYAMHTDAGGNIWFTSGKDEGLCCYDGRTLQRITPPKFGMISSVTEDAFGKIWFQAWEHGICRYDGAAITEHFFRKTDALNNMEIAMTPDDKGNFWLSSYQKPNIMYKYDGKTLLPFALTGDLANLPAWFIFQDKAGNDWFAAPKMGLFRYREQVFTRFSE